MLVIYIYCCCVAWKFNLFLSLSSWMEELDIEYRGSKLPLRARPPLAPADVMQFSCQGINSIFMFFFLHFQVKIVLFFPRLCCFPPKGRNLHLSCTLWKFVLLFSTCSATQATFRVEGRKSIGQFGSRRRKSIEWESEEEKSNSRPRRTFLSFSSVIFPPESVKSMSYYVT